MRKYSKEFLKIAEPIDLAVVTNALQHDLIYKRRKMIMIKDKDNISSEKLLKALEKIDLPGVEEWDDMGEEEKARWNNNKELFEDATLPLEECIFNEAVENLKNYLKKNNLKCMVLGLSGGIDSTLAALICHEVEKETGIELVGISMPLKNTQEEQGGAIVTGKAWVKGDDNFFIFPIEGIYDQFQLDLQMFGGGWNSRKEKYVGEDSEDTNLRIGKSSRIANGNIMARIRMTLLYHVAGVRKGLTISTGNKTENELGFFTLHGDEPMDYPLLAWMYKSDVYDVMKWYLKKNQSSLSPDQITSIESALKILPTDGNGIDTDLHQILGEEYVKELEKNKPKDIGLGEMGYRQIDSVLKDEESAKEIPQEIKDKVLERKEKAKFKQKYVNFNPADFK